MNCKPTVLIVDDEAAIRDGLQRAFRAAPWTTQVAKDGESAIARLDAAPAAVLVTDESMPGMQGWELLDHVRAHHPSIIPIMLTGSASIGLAMRAINQGRVFRFLAKPSSSEEIADAIGAALVHHRINHALSSLLWLLRRERSGANDPMPTAPLPWLSTHADTTALAERLEAEMQAACSRFRRS